jgi:hypothetical protein
LWKIPVPEPGVNKNKKKGGKKKTDFRRNEKLVNSTNGDFIALCKLNTFTKEKNTISRIDE